MATDKSMNVLIVDDHKTMLRIVHNPPEQIGFQNVVEVSDDTETLVRLCAGSFRLIVSN